MLFKEAITQALAKCEFKAGYTACDDEFGFKLREILKPFAEKYHFTGMGVSSGFGRGNKKLALYLTYYMEETDTYAYVGEVLTFDSKRIKGRAHHDYWAGSYNEYKVCDARTHDGIYDDADLDEFFKNIEQTNPIILEAIAAQDRTKNIIADNANLIENLSSFMEQLMSIENDEDRMIVLKAVKDKTGFYISCYK